MTQLQFLLNDRPVGLSDVGASDTLLDHLRLVRRLTGTKEGCAEGDCGACTVLSGRLTPGGLVYEPVNACIRLLAACHATHIVTIEHLRGPQGGAADGSGPAEMTGDAAGDTAGGAAAVADTTLSAGMAGGMTTGMSAGMATGMTTGMTTGMSGDRSQAAGGAGRGDARAPADGVAPRAACLHPVQQAMVDHHGSQCGFCTPGIVMALYGLWMADPEADARAIEVALQGNICRCTGYEPIIRAALAAGAAGGQAQDALTLERAAVTRALAAMRQGGRVTLSRGASRRASRGAGGPGTVPGAGQTGDPGAGRDMGQNAGRNAGDDAGRNAASGPPMPAPPMPAPTMSAPTARSSPATPTIWRRRCWPSRRRRWWRGRPMWGCG